MKVSAEERFWSKIDKTPGGCWMWAADGYGNFKLNGRAMKAHRMAYEFTHGRIPEGKDLDHLCRTRACVNPAHLEPVTRRENVARGVGYTAVQSRKTHCNSGHPFDAANTYNWRGHRICRACRVARRERVKR